MKWQRGHESADVEDRRGSRGRRTAAVGGGSVVVVILAALISQALGVDVSGLFGGGSSGSSGSSSSGGGGAPPDKGEAYQFVNWTIDDIQDTFTKVFRDEGRTYRRAGLVLFTDATDTGCGRSSSAIGPFYCPPDEKAYIDLTFFDVLRDRLGAGGDFAQAYVLAHEIGHHVQKLVVVGGDDSVRTELQADCYAGVWAHSSGKRGMIEQGDVEEAVNAAAQIGDDRLQERAGEDVNPETFTHGTSAQRVKWFQRGYQDGRLEACDTFSPRTP